MRCAAPASRRQRETSWPAVSCWSASPSRRLGPVSRLQRTRGVHALRRHARHHHGRERVLRHHAGPARHGRCDREGRAARPPRTASAPSSAPCTTAYFTLPVLFVMISNHYAMTWSHEYNWLVLIAICLAGALVARALSSRRTSASRPRCRPASRRVLMIGVVAAIAPRPSAVAAPNVASGEGTGTGRRRGRHARRGARHRHRSAAPPATRRTRRTPASPPHRRASCWRPRSRPSRHRRRHPPADRRDEGHAARQPHGHHGRGARRARSVGTAPAPWPRWNSAPWRPSARSPSSGSTPRPSPRSAT